MTVDSLKAAIRRYEQKKAETFPVNPIEVFSQWQQQEKARQALGLIRNSALTALAIGAGGRGALGLAQLLNRNLTARPEKRIERKIKLPVNPAAVRKEEKEKAAEVPSPPQLNPYTLPWTRPGMTVASLAGLVGGWKLIDAIMDKRRKQEAEKDLSTARKEFEIAMQERWQPLFKTSADASQLDASLDQLYDCMVKVSSTTSDMTGAAIGWYGALATLFAALSGAATFNMTRSRNRRKLLDKAIKKHEKERANYAAPPLTFEYPE